MTGPYFSSICLFTGVLLSGVAMKSRGLTSVLTGFLGGNLIGFPLLHLLGN